MGKTRSRLCSALLPTSPEGVRRAQGKIRGELEKLDENEEVFPLFPVPDRANPHPQPVRFVNDAGVYQPGGSPPSSRQAPIRRHPDRPATSPLVPHREPVVLAAGQLYAAEGDFAASWKSFQSISWGRAYGNRKVFMDHRQAVEAWLLTDQPRKISADEPLLAQAPATDSDPPPEPAEKPPISMRTIWIYFGVVGVIGLFAFIPAMSRRVRGDCGPAG